MGVKNVKIRTFVSNVFLIYLESWKKTIVFVNKVIFRTRTKHAKVNTNHIKNAITHAMNVIIIIVLLIVLTVMIKILDN